MNSAEIELIKTNLRRYTFESPKIFSWVNSKCRGKCLNLFAGKTLLSFSGEEVRNDIDTSMKADYHLDAYDCVLYLASLIDDNKISKFDTVLLDPPYAYRKAMEMYNGNYTSRFKQIADNIDRILNYNGHVISFGYHSTFMGNKRGYKLSNMAVFAHGGAQHCTIAIIEKRFGDKP